MRLVTGAVVVVGAALIAVLFWITLRDPEARQRRRRAQHRAAESDPSSTRLRFSHVVEEQIEPSAEYGRPARWVEVFRTTDRETADRKLAELMHDDPRGDYRLVIGADGRTAPLVPPATPAGLTSPRARQEPPMTFTEVPADAPLWQRLRHHANSDDVTAEVARRLYLRILGPRGTNPEQTGDPELVRFFHNPDGSLIDRDRLERHMSHFLMAALGGPKRYSGRGMAAAHADRQITDAAFDRVLWHVVQVLHELRVPEAWIGEIGAAVAPLRPAIVTTPPAEVTG
jgi:truncated hemoglobin YjbI